MKNDWYYLTGVSEGSAHMTNLATKLVIVLKITILLFHNDIYHIMTILNFIYSSIKNKCYNLNIRHIQKEITIHYINEQIISVKFTLITRAVCFYFTWYYSTIRQGRLYFIFTLIYCDRYNEVIILLPTLYTKKYNLLSFFILCAN